MFEGIFYLAVGLLFLAVGSIVQQIAYWLVGKRLPPTDSGRDNYFFLN